METIDKPVVDVINEVGKGKDHLFRFPDQKVALCGYRRKSKGPLQEYRGPTNHHCQTCVLISES